MFHPCYCIDGPVQERRNSSALAEELRLSCINPTVCTHRLVIRWCYGLDVVVNFKTLFELTLPGMGCIACPCSCHATMHARSAVVHWNEDIVISTKFSPLAAQKVVILTTSSAVTDEHFTKIAFPFQCVNWRSLPPCGAEAAILWDTAARSISWLLIAWLLE